MFTFTVIAAILWSTKNTNLIVPSQSWWSSKLKNKDVHKLGKVELIDFMSHKLIVTNKTKRYTPVSHTQFLTISPLSAYTQTWTPPWVYKRSHTLIEDRSACVKGNRDSALWRAESVRLLNVDIQMCEWREREILECV